MRQLPLNVFLNITFTPRPHQETLDSCWVWTGCKTTGGYGVVKFEGRSQYTNRLVYQLLVGPIPKGMVMVSSCRVQACCNPAHLEPVTRDVVAKLRDRWEAERKERKRRAKRERKERRRLELSVTEDWCV